MNEIVSQNTSNLPAIFDMADRLSKSTIVPKDYQGNAGNCLIALQTADSVGIPSLMVMQSLNIVYGKTSWSGKFCSAMILKKFGNIDYEMGDFGLKKVNGIEIQNLTCRVIVDNNGKRIQGAQVSLEMAVREGWYQKNGSKWQTMPELMLRYRSASFFANSYCPELLLGIPTDEEVIDSTGFDPNLEVKSHENKTEEKPKAESFKPKKAEKTTAREEVFSAEVVTNSKPELSEVPKATVNSKFAEMFKK